MTRKARAKDLGHHPADKKLERLEWAWVGSLDSVLLDEGD